MIFHDFSEFPPLFEENEPPGETIRPGGPLTQATGPLHSVWGGGNLILRGTGSPVLTGKSMLTDTLPLHTNRLINVK